jgi:hypothetical protein
MSPDTRALEAPLRMRSAEECARFERESFGALHQMLTRLDEGQRETTWREVEEVLGAFAGPEGFVAPGEILIGSAVR